MSDHEIVERAEDVVDRLRLICDQCVCVMPYVRLKKLETSMSLMVAISCHDGPHILRLPFLIARRAVVMKEAGAPVTLLRSQLYELTASEIDVMAADLERNLLETEEAIVELKKVQTL